MLKQGLRGVICCLVMGVVMVFTFGTAEPSIKRPYEKEETILNHREVEIGGNFFDIYINQEEGEITIFGTTEDWEEDERVKKIFRPEKPPQLQTYLQTRSRIIDKN